MTPANKFALLYKDEAEPKPPPMCGQSAVSKVLRFSSTLQKATTPRHKNQLSKPSRHSNNDHKANENLYLDQSTRMSTPETVSSSSEEESCNALKQEMHVPQYVVHFEEDDGPSLYRVDKNIKIPEDPPIKQITDTNIQTDDTDYSDRWPVWKSTLSAITEETTYSEQSSALFSVPKKVGVKKRISESSKRSCSSVEDADVFHSMRELIMKQKAALNELNEQNKEFRNMILECRGEVSELKEDRRKQTDLIKKQRQERESFANEVTRLKEEINALRVDLKEEKLDPLVDTKFLDLLHNKTFVDPCQRLEEEAFNFDDFKKALLLNQTFPNHSTISSKTEESGFTQSQFGDVLSKSTNCIGNNRPKPKLDSSKRSNHKPSNAKDTPESNSENHSSQLESSPSAGSNTCLLGPFASFIKSAQPSSNNTIDIVQSGLERGGCIGFNKSNVGSGGTISLHDLLYVSSGSDDGLPCNTVGCNTDSTENLKVFKNRLDNIQQKGAIRRNNDVSSPMSDLSMLPVLTRNSKNKRKKSGQTKGRVRWTDFE